MTKNGVIRCVLSVVLLVYLAAALAYASSAASADRCKKLEINIASTRSSGFVTAQDIDEELQGLGGRISGIAQRSLNTLDIERKIQVMDNIESVNCVILSNGDVKLDVEPLVPVARVFDTANGTNYYINKDGKQMSANARYRLDVPVVTGRFSENVRPQDVIPVLDYIAADAGLSSLVSSLKVERNGDVYIIPRVRGHVVNLGDTAGLDNKIERLMVFYRKVLPVKGWEYYDTISVKWQGQIVAKKHGGKGGGEAPVEFDEDYIDDPSTMGASEQQP